jgi:hypothetical protein
MIDFGGDDLPAAFARFGKIMRVKKVGFPWMVSSMESNRASTVIATACSSGLALEPVSRVNY